MDNRTYTKHEILELLSGLDDAVARSLEAKMELPWEVEGDRTAIEAAMVGLTEQIRIIINSTRRFYE